MRENDIIKIIKRDNINIRNLHNNAVFPSQSILIIEFRNGNKRILDLASQKDMTEVGYFEVMENDKTKDKVIFIDEQE